MEKLVSDPQVDKILYSKISEATLKDSLIIINKFVKDFNKEAQTLALETFLAL